MKSKASNNVENSNAPSDEEDISILESSINTIQNDLNTLRKFVARRFDEVSMEINAASQMIDMSEESIGLRFGEIIEVLNAISYREEGDTSHDTGVELDAVIQQTEEAANAILDSAEYISDAINSDIEWNNKEEREKCIKKISSNVEDILLACSFQDLTGQRIHKALSNLQQIEGQLSSILDRLGIDVIHPESTEAGKAVRNENKATSQEDIDALFSKDS